jgi:hypothetical protein
MDPTLTGAQCRGPARTTLSHGWLAFLFILACPPPVSAESDLPRLVQKVLPSVVTILARRGNGEALSGGSGFVVAADRVATNWHVITGADQVTVVTPAGVRLAATEFSANGAHDLAILTVPSLGLAPLPLGSSEALVAGQSVVAAGAPLGLTASVSEGIVSAQREVEGVRVIQNTAPISQGSSGGPLLDRQGRVVGYNSFYLEGGQNINFAHRVEHIAPLLLPREIRYPLDASAVLHEVPVAEKLDEAAPKPNYPTPAPYRDTLLSLVAQPAFGGDALSAQLLGRAELESWDVGRERLLFSLSRTAVGEREARSAVVAESKRFIADPTRIELSEAAGMRLAVAEFEALRTDERHVMFAVDLGNIQFKDSDELVFPYRDVQYRATPAELESYLQRYSVYGGLLTVPLERYAEGYGSPQLVNLGTMVARSGEPSLTRFAAALAGNAEGRERLQRLVGFVTQDIALATDAGEDRLLKDPASILMTGAASPGGRVVLLASLLEQISVPYVIVYGPSGAWIAVDGKGLYKPSQGSGFAWNSRIWSLIDLRRSDFRLGETPVVSTPLASFFFVQDVSNDGAIFEPQSGQLAFETR